MTKTGRIITATLLTIATIGLIFFAVKKSNKRIPTYATDIFTSFTNDSNWQIESISARPELDDDNIWSYRYKTTIKSEGNQKTITINMLNIDLPPNYTDEPVTSTNNNIIQFTTTKEIKKVLTLSSESVETKYNNGNIDHYKQWFSVWVYFTDDTMTTNPLTNLIYTTVNTEYIDEYAYIKCDTNIEVKDMVDSMLNYGESKYINGYLTAEQYASPIALQPLMLNILTMPFTFITQAFDVTLWPNTAYAFNFANFIKGLIAIATILFIIRLFTSGFSIIGNYSNNVQERRLNKSKIEVNKATARRQNKLADKGK